MDITIGNDTYLNVTGLSITALTTLLNYTILNSTVLLNVTIPTLDPDPAHGRPSRPVPPCVPNPDMAGIGVSRSESIARAWLRAIKVIVSSVAAASLSIILCLAMFAIAAFDVFNHGLGRNRSILEPLSDILQETIASLGITQIATSMAFLMCIFFYYGESIYRDNSDIGFSDPHIVLAICQCWLAVYSQLALTSVLHIPGKTPRMALIIRTAISIIGFSTIVWLSMIGNSTEYRSEFGSLIFFGSIIGLILVYAPMFGIQCVTITARLRLVLMAFTIYSLIWMGTILSYMVSFKYLGLDGCDMNTPEDNEWTLGQLFVVVMLIAPIISFIETYISMLCIQ